MTLHKSLEHRANEVPVVATVEAEDVLRQELSEQAMTDPVVSGLRIGLAGSPVALDVLGVDEVVAEDPPEG